VLDAMFKNVQNCCMFFDTVMLFLGGAFAGVIALLIQDRSIRSRLYSLESDLIDLQTKVISEVKKRAQASRSKDIDGELLEKLKTAKDNGDQRPWWLKQYPGKEA